jgi:hypothetical protein
MVATAPSAPPAGAGSDLARRIAALRADLTAAREKERRLRDSIQMRQTTLNRLQTQLAYGGGCDVAHSGHGR